MNINDDPNPNTHTSRNGTDEQAAAHRLTAAATDTPATSAKESNETDIQMKPEKAAFRTSKEEATVASEALRYPNADEIYPEEARP